MAHKKAGGSTKNGRDSNPKMRGIKVFGGSEVIPGNIILRQKGNKYFPGTGVGMGKDFTIFSKIKGIVEFKEKKLRKFDGRIFKDIFVNVIAS